MGVPSYIINWDEFAIELSKGIKIDSINVDNSGIEEILETNFPQITDLLKDILEEVKLIKGKYEGYSQKMYGINFKVTSELTTREFVSEKNIYLTGVTFSHDRLSETGDSFDLSIINEDAEIIFSQVSFKDTLQHKHFNKFFPILAGTRLKITHHTKKNHNKHVWYDLEFLEWTGKD